MSKEPLQLSCVIVNYKTPDLIITLLPDLVNELVHLHAKIVIVDNNSADGSVEKLTAWIQSRDLSVGVIVVESKFNCGFAAGNNIGIKLLKSKYYLLLNSDTLIRNGAIRKLVVTAESSNRVGIVSPRLEWPDGIGQESCFRFHTPWSEFLGAAKTRVFETAFRRFVVAMPVQNRTAGPDWTSFACVLIKTEVFQSVGMLDEGYFMYFEDVEFCYRARMAGWEIKHNPNARVVHLRGGSSPVKEMTKLKRRLPRYYYESRTRFFYQTYGRIGLTAANLFWWVGRLLSKTRQILGRTDKAANAGEWLDIWVNWLNPLKPYTHPDIEKSNT